MIQTLNFLRHYAVYLWMVQSGFAALLCWWTVRILRVYRKAHPDETTLMPFLESLSRWRGTFVAGLFLLGPINLWSQKFVPNTPLPEGLPVVVYLSSICTLLFLVLWPSKEAWLAYRQIRFMFSEDDTSPSRQKTT